MKIKTFLGLCLIALTLIGCKQDNWMDWKTQNTLWLNQNKLGTTIQVLPSGVQYRIIADPNPTDAHPSASSIINCDYTCTLINGMQVDGGQGSLQLSNCVKGFAEGVKLIHCHGDIEIFVPYDLGYGENEQGTEGTIPYIPPYSTLIFKVHLISLIN